MSMTLRAITRMHRSLIAIQNSSSRRQARVRIGGRDSSGKVRFGARRRGSSAAMMKIFLLPNLATQSPCTGRFHGIAESLRHRSCIDHPVRESKKHCNKSDSCNIYERRRASLRQFFHHGESAL
jgi:hypothetical protein